MPTPAAPDTGAVARAGDPFTFRALGVELLALIVTTAALLRRHWLPALVLALVGVTAHLYLRDLSVVVGRLGPVPGMLTLTLVPFSTLLSTVAILLVLRRRERSRNLVRDLIAALGSVLVPFLVVYESGEGLKDDLRYYGYEGVSDDIARLGLDGDFQSDRVVDGSSAVVLVITAVALLLRLVGTRLSERESLWSDRDSPWRMALRIVIGYFELVWIVIGAYALGYYVASASGWWHSRVIGRAAGAWWDSIDLSFPAVSGLVAGLVSAGDTLLAAAATAVLVPLAWLTMGMVVYGVRTSEAVSVTDVAASRLPFARRVATRADDPRVRRAWERVSEPEGRFGMLVGGIGLMIRSGWAPLAAFCLLYMLLAAVPYLVWGVFRAITPDLDLSGWNAWWAPLYQTADVLTLLLTATLLAAAADRLLARLGAPTALRLPERPIR
ncbi:hypothetical protein [Ruania halotolerans]|uniref:hypothetical protein n=1 Tax=Ruania halotolerans TaxID=2897773 RepID=UPI001E5631B4|nr:hypothetical protein [Ruania halotolerans]UFU07062.1 hypothetical protein LQF10_02815 [Ruania halotolerans]